MCLARLQSHKQTRFVLQRSHYNEAERTDTQTESERTAALTAALSVSVSLYVCCLLAHCSSWQINIHLTESLRAQHTHTHRRQVKRKHATTTTTTLKASECGNLFSLSPTKKHKTTTATISLLVLLPTPTHQTQCARSTLFCLLPSICQ